MRHRYQAGRANEGVNP